jgi:hypothetical protein
MDVFALSLQLKEEGAATVKAAMEKLGKEFDAAKKDATGLDDSLGKLKKGLAGLAAGLTGAAFLKKVIEETSTAQFAQAQLAAALKSTGNAADQTISQLNDHAEALSRVSTFGDDAISKAQALLMTFTRISGPTFTRATEAILDMAQAMGTDLQGATIQIGKALNNPVQGVTALARAGVQFSDDQKAMIASLVESNQLLKAQDIILKELETQFGGSAKAARNTLGGALQGLSNEFGNLFEVSGESSAGIVKAINSIAAAIVPLSNVLNTALQNFQAFFVEIARAAQNLFLIVKRIAVFMAQTFIKLLTPLTWLPGKAGENAAYGLGLMQAALKDVDAALAAEQKVVQDTADELLRMIYVGERAAEVARKATTAGAGAGGPRRETPEEVAKRIGARAVTGGMATSTKFTVAGVDPAVLVREKVAQVQPMLSEARVQFLAQVEQLAADLDRGITVTLGQSLAAGIENAITSGSIKEGFKSLLSTMLQGLGNILVQLGTALLPVGKLIAKLWSSLATLNPIAMTAAAVGLIAVGSIMKGIAGRVVGGGGGGGAGMGGSYVSSMAGGGAGGAMSLPGLTYAPTAAGSAATIQQIPNMNVTIIGPNDPSAQRQMQELMRNANRRGNA